MTTSKQKKKVKQDPQKAQTPSILDSIQKTVVYGNPYQRDSLSRNADRYGPTYKTSHSEL